VGADLGLAMARLVCFPLPFSFFSYLWGLVVISYFFHNLIHHIYGFINILEYIVNPLDFDTFFCLLLVFSVFI
jgi:hypothetical protein